MRRARCSIGRGFHNVVPSMAQRGGDFSQSTTVIVNPATGKPFLARYPPEPDYSSGPFLLKYMPLPTLSPARSIAPSTPTDSSSNWIRDIKWITRSQPPITSWRYSIADNRETDPNPYTPWAASPCAAAVRTRSTMDHIFNPNGSMKRSFLLQKLLLFHQLLPGQNINDEAGIQE